MAEGDEAAYASTMPGPQTPTDSPTSLTLSGIDPAILLPSLEADKELAQKIYASEVPFKEGKKHKERKDRKKKHSSKGRHRDQFLQCGMGAGRVHLNPE